MKPDPFDAFQALPSPANAVRLAIADHKLAQLNPDWPFVDALNKAADQLDERAEMLAALEALLGQADLGEVDEETQIIVDKAQAVINRANA
jgi:hypothetical protein